MTFLGALVLASVLSFAQSAPTATAPAAPAVKTGHWEKKPSSLLNFDADGNLSSEIQLAASDDGLDSHVRETIGGVSADGRLAWNLEKTVTWNPSRTKIIGTKRRLRLLGSDGRTLWDSSDADAPQEGGDPLLFSKDGETTLLSEHAASGWRLVARDYLGTLIMEAGPFPELQRTSLTPDGRFAMARWMVPDKSATHTFLDLSKKTRKDVASDTFSLGKARLDDDGKVWSGRKLAFDLAAEPEKKP